MADAVTLERAIGDPLHVTGDFLVGEQRFAGIEAAAQIFLAGDELVNRAMAFAAKIEAAGPHVFQGKILAEPRVAVARLGDEMVKSEAGEVFTEAEVARAVGAALGDLAIWH